MTTDLRAGSAGPCGGEILVYATDDGRSRVECRFDGETTWLTQALLAELFQKDVRTINEHLKNIFADGELDPASSIREFRIDEIQSHSRGLAARNSSSKQSLQDEIAATREVQRTVKHYNLQAILAVGFRVRSPRGAQFRRWASERLQEYLVKGFTMDDERLRNPPAAGLGVSRPSRNVTDPAAVLFTRPGGPDVPSSPSPVCRRAEDRAGQKGHPMDKVPISQLCNENDLKPT